MRSKNQIVSLSGGKDSTAMLLMMLERNEPIHSVVWFDTGWEFPEMYPHIEKLEKHSGIRVTRLKYHREFDEIMKKWKWPSPTRRWCTAAKRDTINKYGGSFSNYVQCIGFASDETKRTYSKSVSKNTRFPLIEYDVTEKDALGYCKKHGFDWGGLYDVFDRVSCFCCPLGGIRDSRKLRRHYPELWKRVLEMDSWLKPNRGYIGYSTAHDLEERFRMEDCQIHMFRRDVA